MEKNQGGTNVVGKTRLEGLSLPVADVSRSVAFYRDVLGFEVEFRAGDSFALIRVDPDGTIGLGVTYHPDPASGWSLESRDGLHVEISTDDLDGLYEELKGRGGDLRRATDGPSLGALDVHPRPRRLQG